VEWFGETSVFDVFIAAVALSTGVYTVYKSLIERARLSVFTGEAVTLVSPMIDTDDPIRLWISGVVINAAAKVGVVEKMRVRLEAPDGIALTGRVTRFVDDPDDPPVLSAARPLSVPPHGSTPFHVEASFQYPEGLPTLWNNGEYVAHIEAWVRTGRAARPRATATFGFGVPDVFEVLAREKGGRMVVSVDGLNKS